MYFSEDDFFITVKASNLINQQQTRLKIVVQSPVEGIRVGVVREVIPEGSTAWFNITDIGNANSFRWMVCIKKDDIVYYLVFLV